MEIDLIQTLLDSQDSQDRRKAIQALKNYDADIAVPLLRSKMHDRDFLVRSFVAMGLGKKQTAESFAALLEMVKFDRDPNVRAEAANSLSLFGQVAAFHLVQIFYQDQHWLVRRSILAALFELDCPEELFESCICGIQGEDLTVRENSIVGLGFLANSVKQKEALSQLLPLVKDDYWRTRLQVAKALSQFQAAEAREALKQLREDEDHRVVGAALESFV